MNLNRVASIVLRELGYVVVAALLLGQPAVAAFTNTVTLRLRQGEVPTTNGAPVAGASAYTGCVDTYIHREYPDTAFSNAPVCLYGGADWKGFPSNAARAYIRFERFENYLPAKARVLSARLYLTSAGDWVEGGSGSDIYYMTVSWTEAVTWNTRPARGQLIGSVLRQPWAPKPDGSNSVLDLSSLVQAWHLGGLANLGISLDCNEDGELHSGRSFYSSDAAALSNRPYLEIVYALTDTAGVFHPAWPGREGRQDVIITNGPTVWSDTYLSADHANYVSASVADLRTYNSANTPRRALLRIETAALSDWLARSSDPLRPGVARLVSASLQISTRTMSDRWFQLWSCAETWAPSAVTDLTRDGANSWAQAWTNTAISNVSDDLGRRDFDVAYHGTAMAWDITGKLQDWIDGLPNTGLVLGHASAAAYLNEVLLTEFGVQHMRPTLVIQTWTPLYRGTVVTVR